MRIGGSATSLQGRAEPAIADDKLVGEVVVHRHVRPVVVPHDGSRILHAAAARERCSIAGNEAVHIAVTELQVDRVGGVIRVHRDGRARQMMHRIAATLVRSANPAATRRHQRDPGVRGIRACGRTIGSPS